MTLAVTSFTMAFVSRFAWPPLISVVRPIMGISFTEAMAYMTAFYMGYVATQIPGGVLADRFGPRLVLGFAMALQGLGTLGIGMTSDYQVGFFLRVVCGLGAGCVYSSCLKAMVAWFSPAQRGLAIGVLMTSPTIGLAIPNFLMPVLEPSLGWQGAFKAVGIALLIISVILFMFMKDASIKGGGPRKSFIVGLKFVVSNRNILFISVAGFSIVWVQIGFGSVGNPYLVSNLGLTVAEAGRIMMIYGLIGLLMPSLAGYLSGKFPLRKNMMIIVCHVVVVGAVLLFGRTTTFSGALAAACLLGLLIAFLNPIYSVITAENAGPEWAATAGGVGNCIFQIAAILSPLAIGMARDQTGTHAWTWWILAAGSILGILATAMVTNAPKEK
jgi:sugar phosphate permease